MPRIVNLSKLEPAFRQLVRPLSDPLPRNPVRLEQSPHDFFASLPKDRIPPNVRIQPWIGKWPATPGINKVELDGGRRTKDYGKEWREGKGRLARRQGGLKWALRER